MYGRQSNINIKLQGGFTLIEVMLVIVIMAVMASLIVMNIQGVDQRKVMQARELLVLDLQKIRLEAVDQGRVLGLVILPETDLVPAAYQVVEYLKQEPEQIYPPLHGIYQPEQYQWKVAKDFQSKPLPQQTSLIIQPLDHQLNLDHLKQNQSRHQPFPQLIWFGTGEVLPVRLQFYLQQQPIGEALELNRLGLIVKDQQGSD